MSVNRKKIGRWYVAYGIFLIACGLAGYASNPVAAKTALMSGGAFGTLSAFWGFWILKGGRLLALLAAGLTTPHALRCLHLALRRQLAGIL
jgi:hypothetical protein